MRVSSVYTCTWSAILTVALAQTTTSVSPSQSSVINAALSSYGESLLGSPQITSLGANLILVPGFNINDATELIPFPTTGSIDYASLATMPPSITAEPSWFSNANADVQSQIQSLQNSALNSAVNIIRDELGYASTSVQAVSTSPSTTSSSSMSGVKGRFRELRSVGVTLLALGCVTCLLAFAL